MTETTSDFRLPTADPTGRAYWRSLDELADTPEFRTFVENEFPSHAAELLSTPSRRQFLKVMGASLALAGLAGLSGCRRWPRRELVPYANRPEYSVPGGKEFFATAMEQGGFAKPLLVTCVDGRPIKIEGNPEHPTSGGAADLHSQASILDLYDPHRLRNVVRDGKASTWDAFETWWTEYAKKLATTSGGGGEGFTILSELTSSPTIARLKAKLLGKYPKARWLTYESIHRNNEIAGTKMTFGKPMRPVYDLSKADVIVALDSDFLMRHADSVRLARQFAEQRRTADTDGTMSRLYVAEPTFTVTGTMADERLAVAASKVAELARQLLDGHAEAWLAQAAADLQSHHGRSIVIAGPDQPAEVHATVAAINEKLSNVGKTVTYIDDDTPLSTDTLPTNTETLVMIGGDPGYDAPFKINATNIIHLTHSANQTTTGPNFRGWVLPRAHYLEAWGDCRAWDGTVSVQQPMIEPLFGGRSAIELLQRLAGEKPDGYGAVRATHNAQANEKAWRKTIHDGLVAGSAIGSQQVAAKAVTTDATEGAKKIGEFEVLVRPDYCAYDGRYANNGWLQELPDPITKIVWGNAALISPADCAKLGVKHGDVLSIGRRDVPVYPMPGQADGVIVLAAGYGREVVGPVGHGVGFDAGAVVRSTEGDVIATGRTMQLVTTQDHHAIDVRKFAEANRRVGQLVRESTLEEYKHHPHFAAHLGLHVLKDDKGMPLQQWDPPVDFDEASEQQWGMAVDLTSCIGCNACVVACQAENNIPIVGQDEVANGREMQWIRIDRYFTGPPEPPEGGTSEVQAVHQPVMCQHCENAPCEQVCPATATVHDSEGLNVMVYNRCIGTRYCSNNCPYKVRRFNYYDYHSKDPHFAAVPWAGMPDAQQQQQVDHVARMHFNPQVTVRMRGVMEKCTYCVQRIQEGKINAKVNGNALKDGDITPACAQTCPTQAIVFGNLKDEASRVRQLHEKNTRTYGILTELNTRPRTKYLARVRNPKSDGTEQH